MLKVEPIDLKEFKKNLYSYYIELFPEEERQPIKILKKLYKKGMEKILKIVDGDATVGFLIYDVLEDNPYVWLAYFAVLPEYQNQKYGSKTIPLLKEFFRDYECIYGEVEKRGMGIDESENEKRDRRVKFYQKLGFTFLEDCDISLWDVVYTPCLLEIKKMNRDKKEIMKNAFELYGEILGEKEVKKHGSYLIRKGSK